MTIKWWLQICVKNLISEFNEIHFLENIIFHLKNERLRLPSKDNHRRFFWDVELEWTTMDK